MKVKQILPLAAAMTIGFHGQAQTHKENPVQTDSTFKPSGKVGVKVYGNFHSTFTKEKNQKGKIQRKHYAAFEITRAYLGYNYQIKKNLTGFAKMDVGKGTASDYSAYLKNAGLSWDINQDLSLSFGLINTLQFHLQEEIWGKRYLYKSFQDEYEYSSSADAGLTVHYKLNKYLKLDAGIFNGEGYKKAQDLNGQFQYAAGITFMPVKGLYIRGYYDFYAISRPHNDSLASTNSIAAFVGYKTDKFSIGAEYNLQNNSRNLKKHNRKGVSIYGEYWITDKIGVFGRYDQLTSNKIHSTDSYSWNRENDQSVSIGGLEYQATEKTFVSLNYRYINPEKTGGYPVNALYFNVQIAF